MLVVTAYELVATSTPGATSVRLCTEPVYHQSLPEHLTGPVKPIGSTEAGHHPAEVR